MKKTLLFTLILACTVCTVGTATGSGRPMVSDSAALPSAEADSALSVATAPTDSDTKGAAKTETIAVCGACEMCADRIEAAAKSVAGVSRAKWNVRKQQLKVTYDTARTSTEAICKAIAAVGHDAGGIKAPDEVYDNLHHCCKYR